MCFRRSQYREDAAAEHTQDRRLWDLFQRETEHSEPPLPVAEEDDVSEPDREEVVVAADR